jgi:hypothetical protein
MQVNLVVFPSEDGLNVVVWGKWTCGTMRFRHFETRSSMISVLQNLRLIDSNDARELENFAFTNSCPLFSSEIDEETLATHGFDLA